MIFVIFGGNQNDAMFDMNLKLLVLVSKTNIHSYNMSSVMFDVNFVLNSYIDQDFNKQTNVHVYIQMSM